MSARTENRPPGDPGAVPDIDSVVAAQFDGPDDINYDVSLQGRYCRPVALRVIVADLVGKFATDLPGRIDEAWLCERPLEFNWRDAERLGECWLSLCLGNSPRILVEDADLAEWIISKLQTEGVLKRFPEIRVRAKEPRYG